MRYLVKAVHPADGIIQTHLDASSEADARQQAGELGLRILSLRAQSRWPTLPGRQRRAGFPLLLFAQELATLLKAGLSLVDAIESLGEKDSDGGTRKILSDVTRLLYEGKSLSVALAQHPQTFPELFVSLIQASERTGEVAGALDRYVAYRTRVDQIRQKLVGASIYPLLDRKSVV